MHCNTTTSPTFIRPPTHTHTHTRTYTHTLHKHHSIIHAITVILTTSPCTFPGKFVPSHLRNHFIFWRQLYYTVLGMSLTGIGVVMRQFKHRGSLTGQLAKYGKVIVHTIRTRGTRVLAAWDHALLFDVWTLKRHWFKQGSEDYNYHYSYGLCYTIACN